MKKIFALILVFLFVSNCTRNITTPRYYVLEFATPPHNDSTITLTKDVCEVLPTQIAELYGQQRIALRKRSHEINYYHYHKWAESPDVNISRLIQRKLDSAALFARVSEEVWNIAPRYQLTSYVSHLEAVEGEDDLIAHLNIKMELYDKEKRQIAVIHEFDHNQALEEWDLNYMALAMSEILQTELNSFSNKIKTYLEAETK